MSISCEGRATFSLIRSIRLVPPAMNFAAGSAAIWRHGVGDVARARIAEIVHRPASPDCLRSLAEHHLLDRGHDVGIRAATADIAAHQLTDFVRRARPAFGDQAGGGTDLAGGAVAALEGVMVDEGLLQRMKRAALRQTLDRRDLRAVLHDRQREARIDPPAIDQNGAGAALAVIAALFGPGQVEVETQRVEKRGPRRDVQFVRHAVDMERDRDLGGPWKFFRRLAGRCGCLSHRVLPGGRIGHVCTPAFEQRKRWHLCVEERSSGSRLSDRAVMPVTFAST